MTIKEWVDHFKIPISLSLVGIVLILGGLYKTSANSSPQAADFPEKSIVDNAQNIIAIDLSGAVNKAGVYKIAEGSRLEDIITAAGGFRADANQEYISKHLNLAQKVSDGMKLYIPFASESAVLDEAISVSAGQKGKLSINKASAPELEGLPGIGEVTASKIISGRPYQKIEDLLNKKIVSKSVYEKIKEQIVN
jgi:competence protein ComEA